MTARPPSGISQESLKAEFPDWDTWRGVASLHYGHRRMTSPPATVRAHNWVVLRERIAAKEASLRSRP